MTGMAVGALALVGAALLASGLIARRAGYPTVMLGSVNRYKLPDNYHWPTDTADQAVSPSGR